MSENSFPLNDDAAVECGPGDHFPLPSMIPNIQVSIIIYGALDTHHSAPVEKKSITRNTRPPPSTLYTPINNTRIIQNYPDGWEPKNSILISNRDMQNCSNHFTMLAPLLWTSISIGFLCKYPVGRITSLRFIFEGVDLVDGKFTRAGFVECLYLNFEHNITRTAIECGKYPRIFCCESKSLPLTDKCCTLEQFLDEIR